MLLEVEAGAPCGRGRGSNDHPAPAVEVASWNFTFSSCHPTLPVALCTACQSMGWEQATRARLEIEVSWKNKGVAVDRRPWLSSAQQPESLRAWQEQSLQLEPFWQKLIV